MLPKVATTILHSTSRAAAAVQNQSHTIRNVLQLQSSSPSSGPSKNGAGSSHPGWGPSSGGSKHHTGSRFQSGYHGASRAASQAQALAANDSGVFQVDDSDEAYPVRVSSIQSPPRLRRSSSSLVLSNSTDRAEKIGILQTVQLHHARARHAFAPSSEAAKAVSPPATPTLTRTRSNSTLVETNSTYILPPSPPLRPQSSTVSSSTLSTDPAAPQSVLPQVPDEDDPHSEDYHRLIAARNANDPQLVAEAVAHLRSISTSPLVPEFNAALEALYETRHAGEPLTVILETYNDMLSRGLLPNFRTYHVLLRVLTDRDYEVDWAIKGIESRRKWRAQLGDDDAPDAAEIDKIETFRSETNFASAMSVFQALVSLNSIHRISDATLTNLLRSCVAHDSVDSAILVWSQIEKRKSLLPTSAMFKHLIYVFSRAGDIKAAEEVFKDFRARCWKGKIAWDRNEDSQGSSSHVAIYNSMIEAYFNCGLPDMGIALLDEMINSTTPTSSEAVDGLTPPVSTFDPTRPPAPGSSTFSTILSGFCKANDLDSALVWFHRLLKQKFPPLHPYKSTLLPTRPDLIAWRLMIEHLASNDKVDEVNALIMHYRDQKLHRTDDIELRHLDRHYVQHANLKRAQELAASATGESSQETIAKAKGYLDFLVSYSVIVPQSARDVKRCQQLWETYIALGYPVEALSVFEAFAHGAAGDMASRRPFSHYFGLFSEKMDAKYQGVPPLSISLAIARLADRFKVSLDFGASVGLVQSYALEKGTLSAPLSVEDWTVLLTSAADVEVLDPATIQKHVPGYAFGGLLSLLTDIHESSAAFDFNAIPSECMIKVVKAVVLVHGIDAVRSFASNPSFVAILNAQYPPYEPPAAPTETSETSNSSAASSPSLASTAPTSVEATSEAAARRYETHFVLNSRLTQEMDGMLTKAYKWTDLTNVCRDTKALFFNNFKKRQIPSPYVIGKMVGVLGRGGDVEGAKRVYTRAQEILTSMADRPQEQSEMWFLIEDSMVIALAQAGDIDGAHVHRLRILEQGGAPSADAYGGLILGVRDTTDDTSNAMALFQESQMRGVRPNQYLYNNIISKLAKARKADQALELFHLMRQNGIPPSSITYGALIGACARVGDVESAETLFEEMVQQDNFKPRVPPYNTMMQLYTTTKPNRERALYYYNQLLAAGVLPTSYTFKLLMETYVLEPINIKQVEAIFDTIVRNSKIELQGAHFATLINAYGCVLKNLNKAINVFDSIPSYKNAPPMDALVFEAMINVIVAHRRMDLLPEFIAKMNFAGVHMTAYIVNSIIRGYSVTGDLESARDIFESLQDPPTGVAGMHNHAPHEPSRATQVNPMEPVYREPSTWEAMVRGELGAGNRDRAIALLERLKTRQYPEAVFNRISGILVDHSMIPMN